jgi:hypothetical protein
MRTGRVLGSFAAIVMLALGSVASAQTAPDRIVRLHDGSIYRGELVELVVGDHITLKLATGEVKRFEWNTVRASEDAVAAPAPPPAPAPAPAAYGEPRAPAPDAEYSVFVEFHADVAGAGLYRVGDASDPNAWELVCTAPCRAEVDRRLQYGVWGSNISASSPFGMPTGTSSISLDANVARRSSRIAGWVTFGVGGGVALAGLLVIAVAEGTKSLDDHACYGSGYNTTYSSSCSSHADDSYDMMRTTGIVMGVGGLAAAVLGLTLGVQNTSVGVKTQIGSGLALGPRGLEF